MELPKNVTQIGEVDRHCKVYVEDYVVSYLKQLNTQAESKEISVALYGRHEQENGLDYHFIYGACKVEQLPREVRHLSQAQLQEVEKYRRKYFPELAFAGYRLLNGEMIEGFYIRDQDICRYIAGYAQFYEKNDAMLAYMLDVRETIQPERVDQEKYERVRQRQEERRAEAAEENNAGQPMSDKLIQLSTSQNLQRMRLAAVAVFALLCLFGFATFKNDTLDSANGEKLVAVNATDISPQEAVQKDKLVIEDKLEDALREENQSEAQGKLGADSQDNAKTQEEADPQASASVQDSVNVQEGVESQENTEIQEGSDSQEQATAREAGALGEQSENVENAGTEITEAGQQATEQTQPVVADTTETLVAEAVAYIIQPGDTLIAISRRQYGTDTRVQDICERNKITDPNNIKQGQVIMLPR
ncbi:MAG: LysM peptidoglycan-binding domain-containing protein [Lachnospiraceae bacterium]|nr:LysM peptidoglycan-binding domain-containing protein [Lachnospiraceae bacterium]